MYRPLSNNEYVIVSKTIYEERGLSGGLAESMFMAYKAKAMALDEAEFEVFKESEIERKAHKEKLPKDQFESDHDLKPMEFLQKLESLVESNTSHGQPKNKYEWFYGDESLLDIRQKRLRVKFYNSERYRKQILQRYFEDGVLQERHINDLAAIGNLIGEFHRMYPGTRQGVICHYEMFFGDSSGFSYETALQRKKFHEDDSFRHEYLSQRNLPIDWQVSDIKMHLKLDAIRSGALSIEQIEAWEK
ncbi:hypothetical protein GCM10011613_25400 [Cellvibrio zantedeschiae]|uniref:Uncharacterized protein n=1 Tax=Cellvibrio zantedeschiae TaxID=1237077 RepID=A0ABQ3B4I6_9GAMM|nr:hypothetical protein [Cellvibrio zantedeschiae]GGY79465.1 hypothetical protein GCM10011613_25400 [Cellvibrio zantedeschiae]